jgi:nucleoside-diphosphate kinase
MQQHYQNPSIPTTEDSLAFIVEWFDKLASIDRPFRLIFYPYDHSIEIIDLKTKRQTLKRIKNDAISPNDLYIGNFLDIYGRRYKVVDYADQSTKELLFARKERTFALIKPDAYSNIGKIIDIIIANGFQINRAQMLRLNEEMVALMFQDQANRPHFKEFCKFMMSDVAVGLEIVGENSIERMQIITGPESPTLAKEGSQNERDKMSIRAVFGTDHTKNAIHVSRDEQGYRKEMEIFFNEKYTLHAGC